MNTRTFEFQPHARYYWFAWAIIVGAVLTVRFALLPRLSPELHPKVGACYMPGVWLPIMLLNLYEGRRLMNYLRGHHPKKWAELTSLLGFGPGWVNGFRSVPWLFSTDVLNDPLLALHKRDYRCFLYWVLTVFFTFPIFVIALNT